MKKIYLRTKAKSLYPAISVIANSNAYATTLRLHADASLHFLFLTQNIGKGPPGRKRTQEKVHSLFRENPPNTQTFRFIKSIDHNKIQTIKFNIQ